MALIDDVKQALRTVNETEVQDLIDAAVMDLKTSGVLNNVTNETQDPLIKRAIITYCKANYGYDNPEAERFTAAYNYLKSFLTLSLDYAYYKIKFTVRDANGVVRLAKVTFNGEIKYTNSLGEAVFFIKQADNVPYNVNGNAVQYTDVTQPADISVML